jgi:hypothetical protein
MRPRVHLLMQFELNLSMVTKVDILELCPRPGDFSMLINFSIACDCHLEK